MVADGALPATLCAAMAMQMRASPVCLFAHRSGRSTYWTVRSYWRRDVDKALSQQGSRATLGDLQAQRDNQAAEAWQLVVSKRTTVYGRCAPCRPACVARMSRQYSGRNRVRCAVI
jgi:hypothetical protein